MVKISSKVHLKLCALQTAVELLQEALRIT